jgi:hypothetical protein
MEMHIRKKQERKLSECDFCVHKNVSFSEVPCCVCRGIFPNRFKEKEKQMETYPLNLTPPTDEEFKNAPVWHDYSFSKEIVAALKDHKPVWYKCNCGQPECNCWVEIKYDEKIVLSDLYDCSWALANPEVKVKRWQWILKGKENKFFMSDAHYKNSEEANKKMNGYYEAMEPYLPSELEVDAV